MEPLNKDAYRQGLRDSQLGPDQLPTRYAGDTPTDALAHRSWRLGMAHGEQLLLAASEFAKQTQCAAGAAQQKAADAEFLEKVATCIVVAL